MELNEIGQLITAIPDFPQPGILFRDIFPVFANPQALKHMLDHLHVLISSSSLMKDIDMIAGLDARGFLFGPMLAMRMQVPFIPIRKKGKLPGRLHQVVYQKEYGVDHFELQADAIDQAKLGKVPRVLIVDDLLATGGSADAATQLLEKAGAKVAGYAFLIELVDLNGAELLHGHHDTGVDRNELVLSLWKY